MTGKNRKKLGLQCRWFKDRYCWQRGKRIKKSECVPCLLTQIRCSIHHQIFDYVKKYPLSSTQASQRKERG